MSFVAGDQELRNCPDSLLDGDLAYARQLTKRQVLTFHLTLGCEFRLRECLHCNYSA